MSDEAILLPKWLPHQGVILAKEQLHHSNTFWTMHILIFSPVYLFLRHPLDWFFFHGVLLLFQLPNSRNSHNHDVEMSIRNNEDNCNSRDGEDFETRLFGNMGTLPPSHTSQVRFDNFLSSIHLPYFLPWIVSSSSEETIQVFVK